MSLNLYVSSMQTTFGWFHANIKRYILYPLMCASLLQTLPSLCALLPIGWDHEVSI